MIGLGVMGRNLVLNIADHGFSVAGYDKDPKQVTALTNETADRAIGCAADIKSFVAMLHRPRAVVMLVPAGAPVDAVIQDLLPHLDSGDLLIDAGNSFFKDTVVRAGRLAAKGIQFLGVGVSGGEEGARHGPSIMPGGPQEAYARIRPIFEAAAAHVDGEPCVTWLGPGAAGHFVKMVHNGIEYGVMQLLAETYDLLRRGLGQSDEEVHAIFAGWNHGALEGYLVEITGHIFTQEDGQTGKRLIDEILDVARQKGTGQWTSQSALDLQVPIPTIDAAVTMRNLSVLESERAAASAALPRLAVSFPGDLSAFLQHLEHALLAATIITYAQGFALLKTASEKFGYALDLAAVARIWRGGCIIRAAVLEPIKDAFRHQPQLANLLLDPALAKTLMDHQEDLRVVVPAAAQLGLPAPGLMSALSYFDAYRSAWLPANLIQAQRDYFGAHTYERIDAQGTFHTVWGET